MKHNFLSVGLLLFLLFLLISTSPTSARKLEPKEEEAEVKINNFASSEKPVVELESVSNLMGLEECQDEDEECRERRVLAEAHLDYIYTQHHKP